MHDNRICLNHRFFQLLFPEHIIIRPVYHAFLPEISVQNILLHHSLCVEERAVKCDRMSHYVDEPVSVLIKHGDNDLLQLVIEKSGIL